MIRKRLYSWVAEVDEAERTAVTRVRRRGMSVGEGGVKAGEGGIIERIMVEIIKEETHHRDGIMNR